MVAVAADSPYNTLPELVTKVKVLAVLAVLAPERLSA